ncbi:ATP-binding protein [Mucilaginibacter sp. CSA2-8R]|uniref:PAS domain-containing sensor histidine kinase n=1 Tax=Mucilaginibacter sp. CSA2-8R TaxID=3141542 RepID=UPI00315D00B9
MPNNRILSKDTLLDILTLSADATAIYTGDDIIIEMANDAMLAFWGKQREIIGLPLYDGVPELHGQPFKQMLQAVLRTGTTDSGVTTAETRINNQLQTHYYEYEYRPIFDNKGEPYAILHRAANVTERETSKRQLTIRETEIKALNKELAASNEELMAMNEELCVTNEDLLATNQHVTRLNTELRKNEQHLKQMVQNVTESEQRFRIMAEGTDVMIAVGDETGDATYFNEAWVKATGRTREELLNHGWIDLMHTDDKDRVVKIFTDAFSKRAPWEWEFRMPDIKGGYRWLLARGQPRLSTDNTFAGYISSTIDITVIKENEQRKNDFISMVSHELKTPLTSLSGYMQLLKSRAVKSQDMQTTGMVEKAIRQVSRMTTLINGFLNVSRLESAHIHIDRIRFDMAKLINEVEDEVLSTIGSHQIVFAPVEATWIHADRDKIGQVINNFISNAVKYSPPGSNINITCEATSNKLVLNVRDEGIGINQEDQPRLFKRYFRVNNSGYQNVAGFGIGLYLCAEIIKQHGGKIGVESKMRKGSTFYFELPLAEL